MARQRSTIEWDDRRDRLVVRDLRRFKGRAIGQRLRELAVLGLEAERLGLRVEELKDGQLVAIRDASLQAVTEQGAALPSPAAAANAEVHPEDGSAGPPSLDPAHEKGLMDLFASTGLNF